MSMSSLLNNFTEANKSEAVRTLIVDSTPNQAFFFMTALSVCMATVGLLINNAAVVIGSMLIAPILSPILGIAMGVVMSDRQLIGRSLLTVAKGGALSAGIAFIVTLFFPDRQQVLGPEILGRTEPSLAYLVIAVAAGLAVAFARMKPDLNETLPGVAISVALIPPLSVVGIGLALFNWSVASGAFLLFLVNIFGIVFAGLLMFSLMNLYVKRGIAATEMRRSEEE